MERIVSEYGGSENVKRVELYDPVSYCHENGYFFEIMPFAMNFCESVVGSRRSEGKLFHDLRLICEKSSNLLAILLLGETNGTLLNGMNLSCNFLS